MLSPFVTITAGFDTGLAVASTSLDPPGSAFYNPNCPANSLGAVTGMTASYFSPNVISLTIVINGTYYNLEAKFLNFTGVPGFNGTGTGVFGRPPSTVLGMGSLTVTNGSITGLGISLTGTGTTFNCTPTKIQTQAYNGQPVLGDPVSTAGGEYVVPPVVDFFLGGPLPLFLRRTYFSDQVENSNVGSAGVSWMTNFDPYIQTDSSGQNLIVIVEGGRVTFKANGNNYQMAFPPALPYQLVRVQSGGFQFLNARTNLIYTFNSNGFLTAIQDRNGNTLTVTQGVAGPAQVADGLGRTLSFSYGASAKLSKIADQTGRSVSYANPSGNLTSVTDANGHTTTYNYNAFAEITSTRRALGNTPYTQTYDSLFRVATQTDSEGNKTTMSYVSGGTAGLNKFTDPLGHTTTYNYANLIDLASFTDAAGNTGSYTYDSAHRPLTYTDRLGNRTVATYDLASGHMASVTDPQDNTTTFTYQAQVQGSFNFYGLAKIGYADGTSDSFTYDASGNVLTATDRAGKKTTYTYNARGQVLTATNPAGGVTTYTYNADATLATLELATGDVTTYSYDNLKRVSKIQYADGTSVSFTRDARDQILSVTDERGKVTKAAYDANNNFQSVTDALNQTSRLTYDTDDLPSTASDPLGNTATFHYDPLGSATAITNAAGETTTFAYDKLERLASAADPAGKGPSYTHDAEGRLASVTDALGNTASIRVNKNGLPTQVTSPLGEIAAISYDALNRVTGLTDALGRQSSVAYESRGLPSAINSPGGLTASFAWGDLPLLSSVTDPNGNVWSYVRDNLGRVTSTADPLGQVRSYKYDARSRVSSVTTPLDSAQLTYDAAGNLTGAQFSDNTALSYTYDDDNRLTGGNGFALGYDAAGRLTFSNGLLIAYDAAGRILAITYAPGQTVNYTYDSRGLLNSVTDWTGASATFTFNDAHQLVTIMRSNGVVTQYSYDPDGRLASITDSNGGNALASIAVTRDAIGRLTSSNRNVPQEAAPSGAANVSLAYDAASQISGATYDARGRLVTDNAGAAYLWNSASRLVSYTRPDGSASFTYDGLGQRISRTGSDGTTLNYVLNYATGLPTVATEQSGGSDVTYYVYTPGGSLLYSIDAASSAHRFYSFDDTGSTTMLTDDSGSLTDAYGISPYGEAVTPGPNNATDNPFTWQGQFGVMQEPGTGLYYARFRYYDSETARFLSRDPLFSPAPREIDPYQYAAGNPVTNVDPMGLKTSNVDALSNMPPNLPAYQGVSLSRVQEELSSLPRLPLPSIYQATPDEGIPQDVIDIRGHGFDPNIRNDVVKFGSATATIQWEMGNPDHDTFTVNLPAAGGTSGCCSELHPAVVQITVTVNGKVSNISLRTGVDFGSGPVGWFDLRSAEGGIPFTVR
ncbi:MAG TPA: RHS repeat-associated core domain-containing protein [Bryobacteraceae bacterium]|nr:RHS repeat-associated core domain-containing protein [Bryobacteraceae bacterium]